MKADISLAERRRIEREQQAEIRAMLAPRHFAVTQEQMAIDAALFQMELEHLRRAAPAIYAILGRGPVEVSAPVVIPEPEPVASALVPESVAVRPGAPDLPFDLRQRFGLR
ncbi:hypothetical protein [Sphingomonas colocasiae]|uniref:Uncharacterized protein n=1 Tax=Sphingomonas colocasiae TaxID=1848973 RepID=A0ABS7PJD5_9SPHN|nr:hypothetical protein [Sphingomonas colocasiae]MBY8821386.1 hypothetical protein [Sphingomonas colocasiae]